MRRPCREVDTAQGTPPPGECLRRIGLADAIVVVVVTKTQHTTNF
jgi:hypothetical protein